MPPLRGGHMGRDKTSARIARWFFWPGLGEDVVRHCVACPECQKAREDRPSPAPLQPLLVVDVPFARIAMGVVGPLPRNSAGNQYILVFVDYATHYPEAVPLRTVMASRIAEELIKWIA